MTTDTELIIKAIENEAYWWRSVESLAKETEFSETLIKDIISCLIEENIIVIAPRCDKLGRTLFTTRNHYKKTRPFFVKLMSALTDRIQ